MTDSQEEPKAGFPEFPYPGLRPFEPSEWPIFFGREKMVESIVELLAEHRLIVVHGSSGCGKSSIIRAGVIPFLGVEHAVQGREWKTAIVRPAGGPLRNIAATLSRELGEPKEGTTGRRRGWLERLAAGRSVLGDVETALRGCSDDNGQSTGRKGPTSFCLVIDQFEELFAWAQNNGDAEAQALIEILCALADATGEAATPHLYVILTMRSDYLGQCARYLGFAEAVNRSQYLLPCMDDTALLEAIHRPAELYGGSVAPDVGDQLLFKARDIADPLPVVQHMLRRAASHAQKRNPENWVITIDDVAEIEGKEGALSAHANEVYAETTESDEERQEAVEWMFRCITGLDTGGRAIRRPRKLKELVDVSGIQKEIAISLIKAFCAEGRNFLNTNPPGSFGDDTSVDISHEALIRNWRRMSDSKIGPDGRRLGWLDREFEAGLTWRALAVQAKDFGRDMAARLDAATTQIRLPFFERIKKRPAWTRRYLIDGEGKENPSDEPEWQAVCKLMDASKENLQREQEALERERENVRRIERYREQEREALHREQEALKRERENVVRIRRYRTQAVIATCVATLVGVYAWQSLSEAGMVMHSQSLVRDAEKETRAGNPAFGVSLALAALPEQIDAPSRPLERSALLVLSGAVRTLQERFIFGHEGPVVSATFSPDGVHILTASEDSTALIWDAASGKEKARIPNRSEVASAVFSPDGKKIVIELTDETARVWDVATAREVRVLRGLDSPEASAIFSPDGRLILATSSKGTRVWDASTGNEMPILPGPARSAVFSPDSKQIVAPSDDGTARVWDVARGKQITLLRGHGDNSKQRIDQAGKVRGGNLQESNVRSAAFSLDSKQIVTASEDRTARVWDAKTGKQLAILNGHTDYVRSAVFNREGTRIVTASEDRTARVWDARNGRLIVTLSGHQDFVRSAVFSPDGARIVTASDDKTARVWDAASGLQLRFLEHADSVRSAEFNPTGTRIVTASDDRTARVWDAAAREAGSILSGHEAEVLSAAFSPDGARIVTASEDHTARVWDVAAGKYILVLKGHELEVFSAAFSQDGARIVTASADETARVWDATTASTPVVLRGHTDYVRSAAFDSEGNRVVTASDDKTVRIWDVATRKEVHVLRGHSDYVRSAVFDRDGSRIVTASDDKTARIWDATTGTEIRVLRGHGDYVRSAAFSPDGTQIVTASDDRTVRIWDAATGEPLRMLRGHEAYVLSASFRPDGTQVVTASEDKTIRVWDASTGDEAYILRGHSGIVSSASFSPRDGNRIVTASADRTARIWYSPLRCQELIDEAKSILAEMGFQPTGAERQTYGLNPSRATLMYQKIRSRVSSLSPALRTPC